MADLVGDMDALFAGDRFGLGFTAACISIREWGAFDGEVMFLLSGDADCYRCGCCI